MQKKAAISFQQTQFASQAVVKTLFLKGEKLLFFAILFTFLLAFKIKNWIILEMMNNEKCNETIS